MKFLSSLESSPHDHSSAGSGLRARSLMGANLWAGAISLALGLTFTASTMAADFTRLAPLPPPRVAAASENYAGAYGPQNLLDGLPATEFASADQGLQTYVEFEFAAPTRIAGFKHRDRKVTPIAGSQLIFLDAAGQELARVPVMHPDRSSAITIQSITPAVAASRVRWNVTKLGASRGPAVGGAEISFFGPGLVETKPTALTVEAVALPVATGHGAASRQPLRIAIDFPYAEATDVVLRVGDLPSQAVHLVAGPQVVEMAIPISTEPRHLPLVMADRIGTELVRSEAVVPPFHELTVYVLPHSHVDIGYTASQSAVEEKQLNNLLAGIAAARQTASYPEGARFVWNLEGLWPADLLQQRLSAEQREAFLAAVRQGQVALNGMYFNTLTGLCRPEELTRLFRFATQLRAQTGAPLDSAMISDVPGCTWGTVTALSQAGIKYFSAAPNYFDRIGDIMVQWQNKPFWWIGPSGQERVLVWVPATGYALSHIIHRLSPQWAVDYVDDLRRTGYPYNIAYIRWAGAGDNGVPDPEICDFVRDWNVSHDWPRFIIGSTHDAFQALEKKHGGQLPEMRGDWTPYWEDGAGSSALETAMNRSTSDRLAQAEALWAMHSPASYPTRDFTDAMRQVLLYDEHTWGASGSVTAPGSQATRDQWAVKRGSAASADTQSRDLLARAQSLAAAGESVTSAIDIVNTNSWLRTEVVLVPKDLSAAGDSVVDEKGGAVASQRLTDGSLAILARDLPAFASRRYMISRGKAHVSETVTVAPTSLDNGRLKLVLDPATGGIVELRATGIAENLADAEAGQSLNEYLYFNGNDPSKVQRNQAVAIRVKEKGPLVASLLVESQAPGCVSLVREVKLVAGQDHVELSNLVDKQRLIAKSYRSAEGKESVNFAFPFRVRDGQVRLEVPFGVIRPDADQIPGSCKNWFTINRWADVANADFGITWVSLDCPLVQIGGLTANLLNSQTDPSVWRKEVGPTQKLYAWVMNNHWGTNYRAFQEGPVLFRFLLRPHLAYDPAAASRLAIAASQPLLAIRAHGAAPAPAPRLSIESPDLIVTALKPSDDGRALIVRLWAGAGRDVKTRITWAAPLPRRVSISDTSEAPLKEAGDLVAVPAWGVVTLRADLP